MFAYLVKWWNNEHITLGGILSDFYKLRNSLADHILRLEGLVSTKNEKVEVLTAQIDQHVAEKDQAVNALTAVTSLLGKVD